MAMQNAGIVLILAPAGGRLRPARSSRRARPRPDSRAALAECSTGPAGGTGRPPPSKECVGPALGLRTVPHSLTFMPMPLGAAPRRAMLWSLLPLKCCNALAKTSSPTRRRSHWMPPFMMTDDLVTPCVSTVSTSGSVTNTAITAAGSSVEARMSASLVTFLKRRRLPAISIRCSWGNSRKARNNLVRSAACLPIQE